MIKSKTKKNNLPKEENISENIYASHGSSKGEINLQWDALKNAKQYIIQISNNGCQNWKHIDIINGEQYTINGLTSGKIYSFRIAPIYINGQGDWIKPVEKKAK